MATQCRLAVPAARRRVALGRALRHLPILEEVWLAGDIGEAYVAVMTRARTDATAERMADDEEMLVGQARQLRVDQFARVMAYWAQLADPDGAERRARDVHEGRRAHLSRTIYDAWVLDALLDPIGGAVVERALRRIERELFEADWAEAKERFGDDVTVAMLARTPAQRRADALVEMARRAAAVPAGARLPEPLFTVLVGYETFAGRVCELADGTVVTPGSLAPWLTQAWVERVVFDGPDRPVNVGVRRRLFTGATRRVVEVRDRECYHDSCDLPAERCEIDHVQPHAAGGLTTIDNGRPACGYHNRWRHRRAQPPP